MLTGSGYNITANNFTSVQATAVGPYDAAYMHGGTGTNSFAGLKGQSGFKGVNYNNIAFGFYAVYAYGAATGYNTAQLTDATGNAAVTINPQTATLSDASATSAPTYEINLASAFQVIQAYENVLGEPAPRPSTARRPPPTSSR